MIGAEELVDLKKQGTIPETIDLWVGDDEKYYSGQWHKYKETIDFPSVTVEDKDNLGALDFRFVFNSTVFIRGKDSDRMLKVYEKVSKCHPARVLIFHCNNTEIEILDSKGLLSGTIEA